MYKLVVIAMFVVAAQAGYLGGYGYAAAPAVAYAAPAVHGPVAYAAPAVHAPVAYAAPAVVKTAVPVATSYANTYKVSVAAAPTYVKAAPVAYAAPAHVAYAAPAYAAPAVVKTAYASPLSYGGYYH